MACQHRENGHALSLCPDCREPFRDIVADLQARYTVLLTAAREVVKEAEAWEETDLRTAIRALAEMVGDDGHRRAS